MIGTVLTSLLRYRFLLTVALAAICILWLGVLANRWQNQAELQQARAEAAEQQVRQAQATLNEMQRRQQALAALDAKYLKELNDAQEKISDLERDVAAGHRRLQLNATCGLPDATRTSGVADAVRPRLDDAAQRDYFTLRQRIALSETQINGLQHYIREQCR